MESVCKEMASAGLYNLLEIIRFNRKKKAILKSSLTVRRDYPISAIINGMMNELSIIFSHSRVIPGGRNHSAITSEAIGLITVITFLRREDL